MEKISPCRDVDSFLPIKICFANFLLETWISYIFVMNNWNISYLLQLFSSIFSAIFSHFSGMEWVTFCTLSLSALCFAPKWICKKEIYLVQWGQYEEQEIVKIITMATRMFHVGTQISSNRFPFKILLSKCVLGFSFIRLLWCQTITKSRISQIAKNDKGESTCRFL